MNSKNKVALRDALYIFAYGLLLSKAALSNTTFLEYIDFRADGFIVINLFAIMIIGFKVIRFDITSPKKILVIVLLTGCVMLSYYYAAYNNLIMLFVLIIGSFNVDIRAIVKCHFAVYGVITVLAFICSTLGVIEDYTVVRILTGDIVLKPTTLSTSYSTEEEANKAYNDNLDKETEKKYVIDSEQAKLLQADLKEMLIKLKNGELNNSNQFLTKNDIQNIGNLKYRRRF